MKIDVTQRIGAVRRELKTVERDGKQASVIVATRLYDTDRDDLWNALTTPERIVRWFMPIEGELRLGGRYQLKGNAGGTITACDPPRAFSVTWEFGGEVSWLDITLAAEDEKTRLTLEHTAFVSDERSKQFGPGAVGVGWDLGLLGLGEHVEGDGSGDTAKEGLAWMMSEEGKAFVRLASDDWARASIAAGTPADDARAAAERTTAVYTGAS
jgi:uncharacterized protein YndB with AHSA1/START domain